MELNKFINELCSHKKHIIVFTIIGLLCFAIYGYISRNDLNEGIEYVSDTNILVNADYENYVVESLKAPKKKNEALIFSDQVIEKTKDNLHKNGIIMDANEIKESIIVKEEDCIVTIYAKAMDADTAKKICQSITNNSLNTIQKHTSGEVMLLSQASEPYTAIINWESDRNNQGEQVCIITKKPIVKIGIVEISKKMIAYGILGGILCFMIACFIYSIKLLILEDRK